MKYIYYNGHVQKKFTSIAKIKENVTYYPECRFSDVIKIFKMEINLFISIYSNKFKYNRWYPETKKTRYFELYKIRFIDAWCKNVGF